MIQLVSVTKKYSEDIVAVDQISFEIQEGEFAFLVGPSGSGKTTIIKMLIREELPSEGKIYFEDEDITRFKRSKVYSLRRRIGVIFQDFKLIPELNAFENIAFAMEAAGRSEKEIKENVPYLLDIVGLSNRMHFFPKQLSGGEKQRVAIARAMANNPRLLIADEPTGNLDPDSAWDIVQILSKINNWGTTVLMSTHGSDIVNSMHKRVLRMDNGKLVRDDFKGSYEEIDEYSFKILSNSAKPAPAKTSNETDKSQPEVTLTQLKQKKSSKGKSDKETKDKHKPESKPGQLKAEPAPDSQNLEAKILEKIDTEVAGKEPELITEAKEHPIAALDLEQRIKDMLLQAKLQTLDDLIEAGVEKIKKVDGLTDTDVAKVATIIEHFVDQKAS